LWFGKGRAKLDLRKTVSVMDSLDAIEIICDAQSFSTENWELIAKKKKLKGFEHISAIRKFSKFLRKFFFTKKQTIFDSKIWEKNPQKKRRQEIYQIFKHCNFIEEKNENYFEIGSILLNPF